MSVAVISAASRALDELLELLTEGGVSATRDSGAFLPAPIGVLVGLPSWIASTLAARTFEVPVLVVSGQPLNTSAAVDRLYAEADAIAALLACDSYRPASWSSSSRVEPLPAVEILATVTVYTLESEV